MLKQQLNSLEETIQEFKKMTSDLLSVWQDSASEKYNQGCVSRIYQYWREYKQDVDVHLNVVYRDEKFLKENLEKCKKILKDLDDYR